MALKPDRIELLTDVSFFMNTTATRGGIVCLSTAGSGVAMDDALAVVSYAAVASGQMPVGVLLNDVVNLDLTRQHINWHKDEVQIGGKVSILRAGVVTTNLIAGTPVAGKPAYLGTDGKMTSVVPTGLSSPSGVTGNMTARVGQFLSTLDADGYAKVSINIV
jgi:hypothetical protein